MKSERAVFVYFAGRTGRRRSVRRWFRIALRQPSRFYGLSLSQVICWLTRSDFTHVAIGDGRHVLDHRASGAALWNRTKFVVDYPSLLWVVVVPAAAPLDIPALVPTRRPSVLATLARFALGGRWPRTVDCVQTAAKGLRQVGVPVPHRMTSPAQLWDWLREQGFEFIPLGEGMATMLRDLPTPTLLAIHQVFKGICQPSLVRNAADMKDEESRHRLTFDAGRYSVAQDVITELKRRKAEGQAVDIKELLQTDV